MLKTLARFLALACLQLPASGLASSPEAELLQDLHDLTAEAGTDRLTRAVLAGDRALGRLDQHAMRVTPAAAARLEARYEVEVARRLGFLNKGLDRLFPPANRLPSGTVVTLDHPAFGRAAYSLGLYAPDEFEGRIGGGVHLLEPFDAGRDVVFLLHGINGGPRDFADLIPSIDRTKYQIWVGYYPTGLEIPAGAAFLERHLRETVRLHPARRILALSHSLGGLVWRSMLSRGADGLNIGASYFVCTPHRGVRFITFDMVKLGCRILWRFIPRPIDDLLEGSDFLRELNRAPPLPMTVRTAAGTRRVELRSRLVGSLIPIENDGLVPLESTPLAGALVHRPLPEDHYSILYSPAFMEELAGWLELDRTR